MKRKLLDPKAVASALKKLPGWKREGEGLEKEFAFETYREGLRFATRVGKKADTRDHHPDLVVGYCRVRVRWTTHDAGGITEADLDGAALTEKVLRKLLR